MNHFLLFWSSKKQKKHILRKLKSQKKHKNPQKIITSTHSLPDSSRAPPFCISTLYRLITPKRPFRLFQSTPQLSVSAPGRPTTSSPRWTRRASCGSGRSNCASEARRWKKRIRAVGSWTPHKLYCVFWWFVCELFDFLLTFFGIFLLIFFDFLLICWIFVGWFTDIAHDSFLVTENRIGWINFVCQHTSASQPELLPHSALTKLPLTCFRWFDFMFLTSNRIGFLSFRILGPEHWHNLNHKKFTNIKAHSKRILKKINPWRLKNQKDMDCSPQTSHQDSPKPPLLGSITKEQKVLS